MEIKKIIENHGVWVSILIYFLSYFMITSSIILILRLTLSILLIIIASFMLILYGYFTFFEAMKTRKYFVMIVSYLVFMLTITLFFAFFYILAPLMGQGCLSYGGECNTSVSIYPLDNFYFSAITLSTLGYGDIHPEGAIFKIISIIEVFIGLGINIVVIGILIANLGREPY